MRLRLSPFRPTDAGPTEPRQRGASGGSVVAPVESDTVAPKGPALALLPLMLLIPALSPQHEPPTHLEKWCALIERSLTEPIRALCSIPVRHYKTETTVHGIAWLLMRDPTLRIVFLTHSFEAAAKWSKRIRQLCEATDKRAGVPKGTYGPTRGWDTIAEWRNESGGGVVVMSADQSKIGYDCHLLIVDDAIDEHGAEDPEVREAVDAAIVFYSARCMRRGKAGAVFIVASRFHPDDPTGRRLARTAIRWIYVHHAAIEYWCRGCETKQSTEKALCEVCGSYTEERAFAPNVWGLDESPARTRGSGEGARSGRAHVVVSPVPERSAPRVGGFVRRANLLRRAADWTVPHLPRRGLRVHECGRLRLLRSDHRAESTDASCT